MLGHRISSLLFTEGPCHVLHASPRGAGPSRPGSLRIAPGRCRRRPQGHRRVAGDQAGQSTLRRDRIPAPGYGPSVRGQSTSGRCRAAEKRGYVGSSMSCPCCSEGARFKGYRPKGLVSALGPLSIERGYYHCPHCKKGHCPADAAFGLDGGELTTGAAELACQEAVAEPLRHMAARVGISEAQRWIAVCDGGAGLEDLLRGHFGRIDEVILDFYHPSEYLGDLAKAWHGGDGEAAEAAHKGWSHRLKHEGGAAILAWLEGLDLTANPRAQATWAEVVTYFRNQHHRMDYPAYLAKGWQIASGPVEAACKLVINERMNGTGMRWGRQGADAIGHLRALYLSESTLWSDFWANRRKAG